MKIDTHNERPAIVEPSKIEVPIAEQITLTNGIKLHWLNCSKQQVIRASFIFRAGSTTQDIPFSASTTANLLSEGSKLHTSQEITEQLDFYGSYYDISLDRDYVVVTFCSLSKFFEKTMEIAREILLMPIFPEHEVEIYAAQRKQHLAMERTRVSSKARELFTKSLFGASHPYGASYDEALYDNLTSNIVQKFYQKQYVAENCFVVCSGMIDQSELAVVADIASQIPNQTTELPEVHFPKPQGVKFAFVGHPKSLQSSIRIGRLLFPRTHPHYMEMQVVASLLGGYFGSRLMNNLREQHGYTYGVYAQMINMMKAGYIAIATEVATEVTMDAIGAILYEVKRLHTELVSEEELQTVRNIMIGEIMRILDGPFGIADVTIESISIGRDNDNVEQLLNTIRTITPKRVQELAQTYLRPEDFTMVISGDPSLEQVLNTQHIL